MGRPLQPPEVPLMIDICALPPAADAGQSETAAGRRRLLPGFGPRARQWCAALQLSRLWGLPTMEAEDRARLGACVMAGRGGAAPLALPDAQTEHFSGETDSDRLRRQVRRLLGLPLAAAPALSRCGLCRADLSGYPPAVRELHLEDCGAALPGVRGAGGYHRPHAAARGAVRRMFGDAGAYAELEAEGVFAGSRARPGDVLAHLPEGLPEGTDTDDVLMVQGGGTELLAIDVTVVRVQAPSHVDSEAARPGGALAAAERAKRAKYRDLVQDSSVSFIPFAIDEYGGLGPAARSLVRRLAARAAGGPASSLAHGRTVGQRRSYWIRRWKRRLSQTVMDAMDQTVQQRLVASCGAVAATLGEL
jgi:hypothetical protein